MGLLEVRSPASPRLICLVWFPEDCQRCERRFQIQNSRFPLEGPSEDSERERGGEPANVDTLTVAASPRDASGIKQLSHAQKEPSKFTKTTLKTGLCCADMRDDWIVICFLSSQIASLSLLLLVVMEEPALVSPPWVSTDGDKQMRGRSSPRLTYLSIYLPPFLPLSLSCLFSQR